MKLKIIFSGLFQAILMEILTDCEIENNFALSGIRINHYQAGFHPGKIYRAPRFSLSSFSFHFVRLD